MHTSVDTMLSFFLQLRPQGFSVAFPFSGDILYDWRHFTGYRKRLPIIASWFWKNSRGIWVILILLCWTHRNLKWSVGFSLDQFTISHRAFSLTCICMASIYANLLEKRKCLYKKRVNSHRIGLEHQHSRRDVMWKRYINPIKQNLYHSTWYANDLFHFSPFRVQQRKQDPGRLPACRLVVPLMSNSAFNKTEQFVVWA